MQLFVSVWPLKGRGFNRVRGGGAPVKKSFVAIYKCLLFGGEANMAEIDFFPFWKDCIESQILSS